jgi:hypothetical protein
VRELEKGASFVWICSRNDALGNLAVMLAAMGGSRHWNRLGRMSLWPLSWAALAYGADGKSSVSTRGASI